jgi:hypothetical protein
MPFIGKTPAQGFVNSVTKDDFTPNGTTTAFTLSKTPATANEIEVYVGNVRQEPTSSYSVSGATLTMTEAPATGTNFYVMHIGGTTQSSTVVGDGTVTSAKLSGELTTPGNLTVKSGIVLDNEDTTLSVGQVLGKIEFKDNDGGGSGAGITSKIESLAISSYGASALTFHTSTTSGGARLALTERFRVQHSGGVTFNGDTADANALDDYEEGSGTNAQLVMKIGSTVVTTTGNGYKYTKIGNIVCFSFEFRATNTNSGSGEPNLTLPFTPSAGHYSAGTVRVYSGTVQGGEFLEVVPGDTGLRFKRNVNNAATGNMTISTNAYYYGSVVYRTDS